MANVRYRFQKPGLISAAVALLAATLATLAVLQYRWIGQTSDGEREKMQKSVKLAAENLSRDFDRELTRTYLEMQIDSTSFERKDWENYALRFHRWKTTAAYPKLVGKVFVADNERGTLHLSAYDETKQRFEETTWLPQFARVKSEIERDLSGAEKNCKVEFLAPDIPALIIPISTVNLLDLQNVQVSSAQNESQIRNLVRCSGYTIVLLDSDYIESELFPLLVSRYFNSAVNDEDSHYDVTVVNRTEPPQIIYQSDSPALPETLDKGDAESDLFALRFDEIQSLLSAAPRLQKQSPTSEEKQERAVSVSVLIAPQSGSNSAMTAAGALFGDERGRWQLIARHRNSSLEAAVETMRQRNLIVSFGILLLLATSGILLVVLSNRSRNFARRQTNFVASVTHELRTPLAVIRAASENIADGIIADNAEIREYGILIKDEERRLSAMVEQVLEFAGAQTANRQHYENRRENIAVMVRAALGDYKSELEDRGFQVVLEIESDLPEIRADREALRRAIGNLVGNAVKYAGEIREKRRLEISVRAAPDKMSKQVEIVVKDNGAGIEKYDLPHIFKLFYRGRKAAESQIKGSGIGLSLVKQIVEAHGGKISVVSETGRGSTFALRLPAATDSDLDGIFTHQNL